MKFIRPHLLPLAGLLILLALTAASSFFNLGAGNFTVTMLISIAKMLLIASFFMELRKPGTLFRLAACTGLLWLTIYLMLILADYATRFPGKLLG